MRDRLFGTMVRFLAGFALVLSCSVLRAQTGSILGTVADSAGLVVSGATVTVNSLSTGLSRTTTTSGAGTYSLNLLPIGGYEITVSKQNFSNFHLPNIQLTVAQALTVNATLEVGTVNQEVTVHVGAGIQDVDTESAQISNLVDQRQIQALPLITRDPYGLVLLSPGTSQTDSSHGGFSVNGARDRNNNFLLDGVDNNDTSVPGQATGGVLAANPDSTEEFRVITDNFNAEFGRNNGAIIDVVTKSGTNTLHGDVYEYGRWNGFGGARDWFNPASQGKMNPYVRNQFGGSIGGPIIKNKTFFFFNEEVDRFRTTLTNQAIVPTPAFKTGVFTYTDPSGVQHPVDLTAANTHGDNPNGLPLDPTMQRVFALYPNPTVASGDGFTGTLFFPSPSADNAYDSVAKIDHRINDHESLSLRYGYDHSTDPDPFHNEILPGGVGSVPEKDITEALTGQLTSTLTNTLVNNFQFGWNHIYATFKCGGLSVLDSPGGLDRFGNGRDYTMNPFTNFGCTALAADGQFRKTGTVSYSDGLSWVHGTNTLKFGFDFRDVGESGADNFFTRRQFTTDAVFLFGSDFGTTNIPGASEPIQDAALALWGFVVEDRTAEFFDKSAVRQATNNKFFRQHEFDWYGQDTWKVRNNLTLTLGLRYQLNGVPYEENGNFSNLLTDPASFPVVFSIVGPGTGRSMYQPDYSDLEPRVGFSWDPWRDGKTAIRAGFGIFHDRVFGNLFGNARGLPPFEQDYDQFPLETIGNAFGTGGVPAATPQTTPSATIPDHALLSSTTILDTHFRNPVANNWNFSVQRNLGGDNVLDIAYVGSQGVHVWSHRDGNPPVPSLVQQLVAICSSPANPQNTTGCTDNEVTSSLLYEGAEFGILPFDAVPHNPLFQPAYQQTEFSSIYHGLQTKFTHRFSRGFQLQGAYTWSHAIDDSVDPLGAAVGAHTFPRDSLHVSENVGNSDNDTRHVAVANYVWEVPLGKGKGYLNRGVLGKILEGMQFSGITTIQSGHPFQVRSSRDSQRTGVPAWGLQVGDPYGPPPTPSCAPNPSLGKVYVTNQCAFQEPPFGSAGSGRNQFYGPGFWDSDLAFAKKIHVGERVAAELRFEGYNIFNHPHFLNPGTDASGVGNLIESSLFGVITSTYTQPDGTTSARQIQAALRVSF